MLSVTLHWKKIRELQANASNDRISLLRADFKRLNRPVVFDQLVSDEEFEAVSDIIASVRFGFGAISTDPHLPIWLGEIGRNSRPVKVALSAIQSFTGVPFNLINCHINLQLHGLDGAFHTDVGDPTEGVTHALNWYVHPYDWPTEYGGYLLMGENPRNLRAVLPARNSAVLIPARLRHCAMAPTRRAGTHARMSLTLKLSVTQ